MEYIIFDLEWNNAYSHKFNIGVNEIIEIGAVKLNDRLEIIDSFKQLIKPQISKKLGSRFVNLTHITMDEVNESGIGFNEAIESFAKWSKGEDVVFLSWSNSDLYALIDNFKRFKNMSYIDFFDKYADAQKYCMSFIESNGNQISLSNCADKFGVNVDKDNLHRALEDCVITACCFKKVYNEKKFSNYIHNCDKEFFERLLFKPYFIKTLNYKGFDINSVNVKCEICGDDLEINNEYVYFNNSFKCSAKCLKCSKAFWVFIRAKRTYDDILVTYRIVEMNKDKAKRLVN